MTKLKTVSIQGKEYVTVNERLKFFRQEYPTYSLRTELVLVDETQALVKAIIRDADDRILAEGTAFEKANSSFINKGSHVENAETSAWGRALGNFGIGIDASVATADEVANAVVNQNKPVAKPAPKPAPVAPKPAPSVDPALDAKRNEILELCKSTKTDPKTLAGMTHDTAFSFLKNILSAQIDSIS